MRAVLAALSWLTVVGGASAQDAAEEPSAPWIVIAQSRDHPIAVGEPAELCFCLIYDAQLTVLETLSGEPFAERPTVRMQIGHLPIARPYTFLMAVWRAENGVLVSGSSWQLIREDHLCLTPAEIANWRVEERFAQAMTDADGRRCVRVLPAQS